uniref:Uncharacterized protein n=1 Tax=Steinernema glaseri TaxID=37863 RepID=A0A1I7YEC3_9BILA
MHPEGYSPLIALTDYCNPLCQKGLTLNSAVDVSATAVMIVPCCPCISERPFAHCNITSFCRLCFDCSARLSFRLRAVQKKIYGERNIHLAFRQLLFPFVRVLMALFFLRYDDMI